MLVLFDSPAGHALFNVLNPGKLKKPDDLWACFEDEESAKKMYAA